MKIEETTGAIINEFDIFDDWMDKYNYLIELGKSLPMIDERYKIESNLIQGCQSRVWLHAEFDGKLVHFTADSDAVITKGIANLLIRVFSDHSPQEILDSSTDFINEIGLTEHLSPTRSNGLLSMIKQIKMYALAFKTKQAMD
ncbi:MAG: SufE family protein [Lentimicrobiaceae bacterium]|nr:SufE family protein [Lentimicrobiaceae bacterium]MCO5265833.1 SufE family protein [Lentimicrobium sp.]HPG32428.1 SufE family protein [Lentimicrobium sp.]